MSFWKASAIAIGFVGVFALGVWTAPQFRTMDTAVTTDVAEAAEDAASRLPAPTAMPPATDDAEFASNDTTMPASAPPVLDHVRSLLNSGADVSMAAEGFRDAEQFVTVAYAAHNTSVPFVVLKQRVLTEGDSLASALREAAPQFDASLEVSRARAEARSDIARLRS